MTPVLWMRDILAGAEAFTARTSPFLTACILSREVLIYFYFFVLFFPSRPLPHPLTTLQLGINSIPAAYRAGLFGNNAAKMVVWLHAAAGLFLCGGCCKCRFLSIVIFSFMVAGDS